MLTWDHLADIWGTDLLGDFLTPGGCFDVLMATVVLLLTLDICGVTHCFKPSAAHCLCLLARLLILALTHQWVVTCPHCVVESNLLETDLACLPISGVIALFLLHCFELGDRGVMAGSNVLMPTLLDLLFFQLFHKSSFKDTD